MNNKKNFWLVLLAVMSLIFASLACGSEATQEEEQAPAVTQAEEQSGQGESIEKTPKVEITNTPAPPTATPVPPTPTLAPIGMSRGNPFPITELVSAPNWEIQVLETIRGDEAWQLIQTTNQYNEPASEGMEYLLVKIYAKCTYADSESHSIGSIDFKVTGDKLTRYSTASVVDPEPALDAELYAQGETEGWVSFAVGIDEGNLILIFDELMSFDEDRYRYIALEDGASVNVDMGLGNIQPTDLGLTREDPIPIGESGITEDWIVSLRDVIRGEEAWVMIQEANQFNELPDEGMEYIAVKVHAKYIKTVDDYVNIDGFYFNATGDNNILYDNPSLVDPEPTFDVYLYPGGEYEGWATFQVGIDETNTMVLFEPTFSFDDEDRRYFALVENASISVPPDVETIEPNDLGMERSNPAPLGEKVITEDWEISVVEMIRGNDAWTMVQEANQFNDPPEAGMEYILIKVHVKNINPEDLAQAFDEYHFEIVGDANISYENPSVVDPDPELDVDLYPTGEYEGWMTLQAGEGETGLVLIYEEGFLGESRFLSIE